MMRWSVIPAALLACALTLLAGSSPARASITVTAQGVEGHDFTFQSLPSSLSVFAGEDGQDVRLMRTAIARVSRDSPVYGGSVTPDPRSIETLANGDLLFTDRNSSLVAEVRRDGSAVWTYSTHDDPDLQHPFSAQRFTRDGQELTLIADRWAYRVWVVDAAKQTVWQYGVTNAQGTSINHLADPFYARYSSADGGTVVIADCNGGNRVIEVNYEDYVAGAPDNGFTAESIVWSYGTPGVEGSGPGLLDKPHSAQRLPDGNVLITDADGARAIEVDRDFGQIVWQYGVTDAPGSADGHLADPNYAARLSDGDTLIVDTGNQRVLRVSPAGQIDEQYDLSVEGRPSWATTDQSAPRAAAYTSDNLLAVVDSQFCQVLLLGYEKAATATSAPLTCGGSGKKAFVSLTWRGDTGQAGVGIGVDYRVDGGKWTRCRFGSFRKYSFPAGTVGKTIAYRVTLTTTNRGHTATLDSIMIQSTKATTGGSGGGGGGSGGTGNSGQNSTSTYPSSAQGGTGTSGTGAGSGSYGAGSGSGSLGTGSGGTGSGAVSTSSARSIDVPVQSTGSGPAQEVQGYQVQGEEGVSGVPLRAAEGPQAPRSERPGPPVPLLALVAAGLAVAAAFLVPWPFVAAHMRRFTGFDHTRPARFLPFRPLGK